MTIVYVRELLDRLGSDKETIQEEILQQLCRLPSSKYPLLFAQIARLREEQDNSSGLFLIPLILAGALFAAQGGLFAILSLCFLLFIPAVLVTIQKCRKAASFQLKYSRLCRLLGQAIEKQRDPDGLPSLLTIFATGASAPAYSASARLIVPVEVKRGVRSALRHLVPRMEAQDYHALTPEQQGVFLSLLNTPYADLPLTLAILEKLSSMGDPQSRKLREILTWLVNQRAATANMQQARTAARVALQRLDQRGREERQAISLLRASDAPLPDVSETLLRPAAARNSMPEAELLRPGPPEAKIG